MRLVVFGATGATGRQLLEQALRAGHRVTAVARRPSAIVERPDGLEVVRGDVLDPRTLGGPIADADAVVSALGIGYSRAATTVYSDGTANIMSAMRSAGVRRLAVVSTTSLELPPPRTDPVQWLFFRCFLRPLLRRPYADIAVMEDRIRESGLEWTLLRAARLTNGPRTGRYRTSDGDRLHAAWSISRADVADFLLAHLDDTRGHPATVEIAY